jgi:hypothetical protein
MRRCILACLVNEGSGGLHNLVQEPTLVLPHNWASTDTFWGRGSEIGVTTYFPSNTAGAVAFKHPDTSFANFQTASNFTLWAYATPPRGAGETAYFSKDNGFDFPYLLRVVNSSPRKFQLYNQGNVITGAQNVDALPLDKFFSLCVVNNASASTRTLYFNSTVDATGASVTISSSVASRLRIFGDDDGSRRPQGSHGGAMIWDRALSPAEVAELAADPFDWVLEPIYRRYFWIVGPPPIIEPGGIASAEAFGTALIETGALTVTPTGIASAEAFGTATLAEVTGDVIVPGGIASAEAFGAAVIDLGETLVGPTGIASAEAFGTPRIFAGEGAATVRFLISGVDRTEYLHHESDFSWNMLKGSRGSCSLPLIIEPGDTFAPQVGETIEIYDPAPTCAWRGTIEQAFIRWFGDDGYHLLIVTGVSHESLFDGDVDRLQFTNVLAGDIVRDLYEASGVTAVTLGVIDDGVLIESLEVTRISDALTSLAQRSNKIWFIDPEDGELNFVAATARPAPFVMASEDMVWESMNWRQSRADFRDTQVIQSPDGESQTIVAVTPNPAIGRRTARLTLTTSYTTAGAIQEGTAALRRFSTLPSQLVVTTDRPGVSLGMLLTIAIDRPLTAAGVLNGSWQVIEVEARMLTGMDRVDPATRRLPSDLSLGHFRYTLHLINALAMAIFQGDGVTTVFTLPVTPGGVSYIRVSPDDELYTVSSSGDEVTIEPAMPEGTYGLVGYEGLASPDAGTFMDTWKGMSPVSASAGPADGGGGTSSQKFIADATLRDLTIQDDAGPHAIVYASGTGTRVLAVLRQVLGADLVVRFNLNGTPMMTVTIDAGTVVDDVLEFPMSSRAFTVTIATPAVVTVEDAALIDDSPVVLHTTGSLPTGLFEDTIYYVVNSAGSSFELSLSIGGSPVDTSGSQAGKHWLTSTAILAPELVDKDVLTYDIRASDEAVDDTPGGFCNLTVEWE